MTSYLNPRIYSLLGINNALSPCSVAHREGTAYRATNSRIDESGLWKKAPGLSALTGVMTGVTAQAIPINSSVNLTGHRHFRQVDILGVSYLATGLKYNTCLQVGPNRYGYLISDKLFETTDSERTVYWWDATGVTKRSVTTASGDYGPAGIGRPRQVTRNATSSGSTTGAIEVFYNVGNTVDTGGAYGGRMERGVYYYMYTYYDTGRQCESLPSPVVDWIATARAGTPSWTGYQNTCKFPILRVYPDATHTVTAGSKRYNSECKVRFYRSKRTSDADSVFAPPNIFYFLGDVDYALDLTATVVTKGATTQFTVTGHGITAATTRMLITGVEGADAGEVNYRVWTVTRDDADKLSIAYNSSAKTITIGTTTLSRMCMEDMFHDEELQDRYEGRGTPPPAGAQFCCPYDNRMYYFYNNIVRWSSSGRPDEVAQEYTFVYALNDPAGTTYYGTKQTQYTEIKVMPFISDFVQAEAKYEISEIVGESVVGAFAFNGRLYVFTENTVGYLKPSISSEGVKYTLIRKGIGCASDKTIALTPYGLFGADRKGIWQITDNNVIRRISENRLDHTDSTKDTYVLQSTICDSFGLWVPNLNEYIWCVVNTGLTTVATTANGLVTNSGTATVTTASAHGLVNGDLITILASSVSDATWSGDDKMVHITKVNATQFTYTTQQADDAAATATVSYLDCRQFAWQPNREIFGGVYEHPKLVGGCEMITDDGAKCYLTPATSGGAGREFSQATSSSLAQTFQFWFGSASLQHVKDQIEHTIVFDSIT